MATARHETDVCIVGGGPAGMVLGLLLAERGKRVLVLEHNPDFAREYRGEVLMPRFVQAFRQIGLERLLEETLHSKLDALRLTWDGRPLVVAPFSRICPEIPYALWMPQPQLLSALHARAREAATFELWFDASARTLIHDGSRVVGVTVRRGAEHQDVRAKVTIGADGRFSTVRHLAGIDLSLDHHDFDLLWFTVEEPQNFAPSFHAMFTPRRNYLVLPKHPRGIQCGMLLRAGEFARLRERGIEAMRDDLLAGPAVMHDFARQVTDFKQFFPLEARLALAREWSRDGLLLIGDAAHTCSPVGAVGVSIAVETAIVASGVISRCLDGNDVSAAALGEVLRLREAEVRRVLRIQQRFATALTRSQRWARPLIAAALRTADFLGLFARFPRALAVRRRALPLGSPPATTN